MNEKIKNKIINQVTSMLYQEFKNHETIETWGGNDWRWKRVYLKNVGYSLINFALYGKCVLAPGRQFAYLKWMANDYKEPRVKYNGVLAIDPANEDTMKQMESILKKQMHDDEIDARATINKIIQIILTICSQ